MTKLRDDGYLETASAVVAACFLRREVLMRRLGTQFHVATELAAVSDDGVQNWKGAEHCYPILIPAATVAEVCGFQRAGNGLWFFEGREEVLATLLAWWLKLPQHELYAWLRTHVKEE